MLFFPWELSAVGLCYALDGMIRRLEQTLAVQSLGGLMPGMGAAMIISSISAAIMLVAALRDMKQFVVGIKLWVPGILAVGGVFAIYEMNLLRLEDCAPHVVVAYRSPAQLFLALPFLHLLNGYEHPDGYTAMAICVALYLWQYDRDAAYTVSCGVSGLFIAMSMSFAVAYLYYYAERARGVSVLVPASLVGLIYALTIFNTWVVTLPLELLRAARYMLLVAAVVRVESMSKYSLAHISLASCAGAAVFQFMSAINAGVCEVFALVFISGVAMVKLVAITLDDALATPKYEGPQGLARAPGKRQAILGCVLLMCVFVYPVGAGRNAEPSMLLSLSQRLQLHHESKREAKAAAKEVGAAGSQQQQHQAAATPQNELPLWRRARLAPARGRIAARPDFPDNELVNATLLYMDSKRKPLEKALKKVQKNFLDCFPYPIHVFKEDLTEEYRRGVEQHTTSQITWHSADHLFDNPPNNITMATVRFWIEVQKLGRGHHFGYRHMCRFFSGVFARFPFFRQYEYYWRLDTDSWISDPVKMDPIRLMVTNGCTYGHMGPPTEDAPDVTVDLLETIVDWARLHNVPEYNVTRLYQGVHKENGQRFAPMYYNNFEIASTRWLAGDDYTSFFDYLDGTDGFMKYRWGDAPVRTFAIYMMLDKSELCDFEPYVPYTHGRYNNKVIREWQDKRARPRQCPAERMKKDHNGKFMAPAVYTS